MFYHSKGSCASQLSTLEQKEAQLADVEVNVVVQLVSHRTAEVHPHEAMPRGIVLPVELFLDVGGEASGCVLAVFEGTPRHCHRILLHWLIHDGRPDDGLSHDSGIGHLKHFRLKIQSRQKKVIFKNVSRISKIYSITNEWAQLMDKLSHTKQTKLELVNYSTGTKV